MIKTQKDRKMQTIIQDKIALSPFDDKRMWLEKNKSVPWGYIYFNENEAKFIKPYNEEDKLFTIMCNCAVRVCITFDHFKEYLGCTKEEFKEHMNSVMENGWAFINYGPVWNIDHIDPLNGKDLKNLNDVRKLCHYLNLRPLSVKDNSAKGGRMFHIQEDEKYIEQRNFSRTRIKPYLFRRINK
jgi:hypothetical protein